MFLSLVSAKRIDLLSRRDPESLVCPLDGTDHSLSELESRHSMVEALKPTVTRKLVLVRHGQYNTEGEEDKERYLTDLGKEQAKITGEMKSIIEF